METLSTLDERVLEAFVGKPNLKKPVNEEYISRGLDSLDQLDIVKIYFEDISKYPLLSTSEELELFKRVKAGEQDASNAFITANLRFVIFVAKKFKSWLHFSDIVEFNDLIQEGNRGLMTALRKFDPDKGKFTTYAFNWIEQYIRRFFQDFRNIIRLPVHVDEALGKMEKIRKYLWRELERDPSPTEIAAEMGVDVENVMLLLEVSSQDILSLDQSINEDDESSVLSDFIEDTGVTLPESSIDRKIIQEKVRRRMKVCLSIREYDILALRFGFSDDKPHTLQEVGVVFDVTRERIRQIEEKACKELAQDSVLRNLIEETSSRRLPNGVLERKIKPTIFKPTPLKTIVAKVITEEQKNTAITIEIVCTHYKITQDAIYELKDTQPISIKASAMVIYLLRINYNYGFNTIARELKANATLVARGYSRMKKIADQREVKLDISNLSLLIQSASIVEVGVS